MTGPRSEPPMPILITFFTLLAGETLPRARAHAVGERRHLVQHRMHFRNHVYAVGKNLLRLRRAQRHMQHRPVLRQIDLFAAEHGITPFLKARLFRQFDQQLDGLVSDAVFRIIEEQSLGLDGKARSAPRIFCKKVAQMNLAHLGGVLFKRLPGGQRGQRSYGFRR